MGGRTILSSSERSFLLKNGFGRGVFHTGCWCQKTVGERTDAGPFAKPFYRKNSSRKPISGPQIRPTLILASHWLCQAIPLALPIASARQCPPQDTQMRPPQSVPRLRPFPAAHLLIDGGRGRDCGGHSEQIGIGVLEAARERGGHLRGHAPPINVCAQSHVRVWGAEGVCAGGKRRGGASGGRRWTGCPWGV